MTYKKALIGSLIIAVLMTIAFRIFVPITNTYTLTIEKLGVKVRVKKATSNEMAQKYIDEDNMAAYCGNIIADHKEHAFKDLKTMEIGDEVVFKGKTYTCGDKTIGYSINGLQPKDEYSAIPPADLYLITCTGAEPYQVHVICLYSKYVK